jgi:L-seryl-tRNA(Ser) seleniumtransferase
MKVGKEEMVGLLAAVELYLKMDHEARAKQCEEIVATWNGAFNQIPGLCAIRDFPNEAGQPLAWSLVTIEAGVVGLSRDEIVKRLLEGDPAVAVASTGTNGIHLNPMTLEPGEDKIVLERFIEVVRS